jgi:hypothetical protein
MLLQFGFFGTLDHFGLGLYCTRVRNRANGHLGMKFSLYLLFFECYLVIDMGARA